MATSSEVFDRKIGTASGEETVQRLIELFGNVLDLEIIQSVALGCNYSMEQTSNILLEMSGNIGAIPKLPKNSKKNRQVSYASATNQPKDDDVIIESEKTINLPGKMNKNVYSLPTTRKTQTIPQHKSKKEQEFDRIVLHVRQGSRILILLRGLPGSGKSYLAREVVSRGVGSADFHNFICSADDFFINRRTGKYQYDPMKIADAHNSSQRKAYTSMERGVSPVVIDNTNLQLWEMKPYVLMATNFGYSIEVVEPFTHWAFNDKELARRNGHDVPRAKIKEMIERYEKNITPGKLLAGFGASYKPNKKPPIGRNYPPNVYNSVQQNGHHNNNASNSLVVSPMRNSGSDTTLPVHKNGAHRKVFQNQPEVHDLMDFDNEVVFVPNVQPDQHSHDLFDSILVNTNNKSPNILKPNVWNLAQKHNLPIVNNFINATEPEMKKARTYFMNTLAEPFQPQTTVEPDTTQPETKDKPQIVEASPKNLTRNAREINEARSMYPKLDLSSWGLPDNAVSSWENWNIVHPLVLDGAEELETAASSIATEDSPSLQTSDSTTNTSSADFALLTKQPVASQEIKILTTTNRNINVDVVVVPPMSPPKKTKLDKSSMTNNDVLSAALCRERDANDEKQIGELLALFPGIPVDYLRDVFEKCKKDLNWAVDLLLDDNKEFLPLLPTDQESVNTGDLVQENQSEFLQVNMEELTIAAPSAKVEQKNKISSEEVQDLKRCIEENIEINKDYYSEHLLKIKNQKYGAAGKQHVDKPCTSSSFDAYSTPSGEVIAVSSDTDLDNFEPDIDFPDSEEDEMMELNLGEGVVSQLESKFGFPEMFPQGFLPIIHIPASTARQLYALYVESVLVQMENQNQILEGIVKEDEEFAKKLQMQEEAMNRNDGRRTPDLQDIMEEQAASNLYQRETEEWKKLTPNDLAAKLTRQKLFAAFPTVDTALLVEILYAHNNSYAQTIEVLLASTERNKVYDPDGTILEPPITETAVNEMQVAEDETKESIYAPEVPKSANEYRDEAEKHYQKHNELIQRAQQAYQQKQYPVAQFYSDLAKKHTQFYDQANNLAASAFLQEHSQRLQNFSTLDLHYLRVKEAISALDMFIDTNIRLLQGSNKKCENLFVITGRGNRSFNGKSRIRPAVMTRLKKRDIWYIQLNPGLLKIRVRSHSVVTSNVS